MLASTVIAVGLLASSNAMAAVSMFLKISGVRGESVDRTHAGEMDVLAWSWGTSTGTARTGKGLLPGSCVQDLSVTKYIDSASPQLIMNGVSGAIAPEAVLTVRKSGDNPVEYLVLRMNQVRVTSFTTGGSGGEDRLTENVTIHFESMRGEYRKQEPNGSVSQPIYFDVVSGVCK